MAASSFSRYFPNPWLDRESQRVAASKLPTSLEHFQEAAKKLFHKCKEHSLTRTVRNEDEDIGTLYCGEPLGFAYLSYVLALHPMTSEDEKNELLRTALDIASRNITLLSRRRKRSMRISLLEGKEIGALALSCAIYQALGDAQKVSLHSNQILQFALPDDRSSTSSSTTSNVVGNLNPSECEVLYGRCGYLHAILFLRKVVLKDENFGSSAVHPILLTILNHGRMVANHFGNPGGLKLMWEWHDKIYLGAAHGIVGILHTLLNFITEISDLEDENEEEYVSLIQDTIVALNDSFCFSSGNLASSLGSKRDTLVHWCHGATGHVLLLVKAFEIWDDLKFFHLAVSIGNDVIWQRGLLRKGVGLCHGISGNAFALLSIYRAVCLCKARLRSVDTSALKLVHSNDICGTYENTANKNAHMNVEEDMWLQRVRLFSTFALQHLNELELTPDRPYSLYEGLGGLCILLLDQCRGEEHYIGRFPLFDF